MLLEIKGEEQLKEENLVCCATKKLVLLHTFMVLLLTTFCFTLGDGIELV